MCIIIYSRSTKSNNSYAPEHQTLIRILLLSIFLFYSTGSKKKKINFSISMKMASELLAPNWKICGIMYLHIFISKSAPLCYVLDGS
ncbi:hypothetical protein GDO81_028027 [Engystomops pustulosus]|uniref:Uncharacterized protein n=1 Tax=Engystomops pustulosus TaxID=76066 RepID=A0AAV6ZPC3_ENGPU|nr:hypothetical protein GDO81_028027 [Engystomops pustulosus]